MLVTHRSSQKQHLPGSIKVAAFGGLLKITAGVAFHHHSEEVIFMDPKEDFSEIRKSGLTLGQNQGP